MADLEKFHKDYDLFNLGIILANEIFPDRYTSQYSGTYSVNIGVVIKKDTGFINVVYTRGIELNQALEEVYEYLNNIGLTDIKIIYDSIVTSKENIQNLVTLYRMKGMIE